MKLSDIISKGTNFGTISLALADGSVASGTLPVTSTNAEVYRASEDTDEIFISTIQKSVKQVGDMISLTLSSTSDAVVLIPSDSGNISTPGDSAVMLSTKAATQLIWNGTKWLATELAVPAFDSTYLMILTTSDTSTTINNKLRNIPKDLGGQTLNIYFPNGTVNFSSYVMFQDFKNGKICLIGNGSSTGTARTDQNSVISVSNTAYLAFYFYRNDCEVEVSKLKIVHESGTNYHYGFYIYYPMEKMTITDCYIDGTLTTGNTDYGIRVYRADSNPVKMEDVRIDGCRYGFYLYYANNVDLSGCVASTDIDYGTYIYRSNVTFSDCTIDADYYGIYSYYSTLYLNDSTISGSYRDIYSRGGRYYYI